MDTPPVFFNVGEDTYRLRFPGLLEGFNGATVKGVPDGRFDSDERDYFIEDYRRGGMKYDIRVSEFGSDLQPARIEARFTVHDKQADIPPDLRETVVRRNEEASRGRTLVYINGMGI